MSHEYTGAPTFSGAMHKLNKEVTRAGQKLSSDDTFRGFMDKAQGAMAFEPMKKAVVKATSLEHGPPKEKHVQYLLHEMREASIREMFEELFLRLHNKDATIVLKAIMVFHRLLGGSPPSYKLFDRIYASRGEFRLARFLDETTHESMQVLPRPPPKLQLCLNGKGVELRGDRDAPSGRHPSILRGSHAHVTSVDTHPALPVFLQRRCASLCSLLHFRQQMAYPGPPWR